MPDATSVELVPHVRADAQVVQAINPAFTALNIPDLTQFTLRGWDACWITKDIIAPSVPHIRAIDLAEGDEHDLCDVLRQNDLAEVLVVPADPPRDLSQRIYPNSSVEVIRRLKLSFRLCAVYAAFDPYRTDFYQELESVRQKLRARPRRSPPERRI